MQEESSNLDRFESWLTQPRTQPDPAFIKSVRSRLALEPKSGQADAWVDFLLEKPHPRPDPAFTRRVVASAQAERSKSSTVTLISWLRPLAAAAILGFSLYVFQQSGDQPTKDVSPLGQQSSELTATNLQDEQITAIFALASALPVQSNVANLPSEAAMAMLRQ